jgi:hypothetical protein
MPLPRDDMALQSIQIGADHGGFGYGAYTLTIHYTLHSESLNDAPGATFARIAGRLFRLIENLQAVTFSVVGNEETDTDNYIYRWSISRTSSEAGGGAITSFRGTHEYEFSDWDEWLEWFISLSPEEQAQISLRPPAGVLENAMNTALFESNSIIDTNPLGILKVG